MMRDDELSQLQSLERAIAKFAEMSKQALGFVGTQEYQGITFEISRRFVIADLLPLAFFHLVEHISDGDVESAIHRLYDRIFPLLSCRHEWTVLKRDCDDHIRMLGRRPGETASGPYICRMCTAYALGHELPVQGRGV